MVVRPNAVIGPILPGTTGRHSWLIHNTGDAPLEMYVQDLNDCSIVPNWLESATVIDARGRRTIPGRGRSFHLAVGPGGQVTLVMKWRSRDRPGHFNNYFLFRTNDPRAPWVRVTLQGDVTPGRADDGGDRLSRSTSDSAVPIPDEGPG